MERLKNGLNHKKRNVEEITVTHTEQSFTVPTFNKYDILQREEGNEEESKVNIGNQKKNLIKENHLKYISA